MTEVYEFTRVNAFAEDPVRHSVSFNTDNGAKCSIEDSGPGKLDIQFVRRAVGEGSMIFLAYDSATGHCNFAAPFNEDHVDSIEMVRDPQPSLKVRLVLRPSFLFLLSTHPRFEDLRKFLVGAKQNDQLIWVGTFPGDNEILDARLPKP